jgi:predicted P-loop ATPase
MVDEPVNFFAIDPADPAGPSEPPPAASEAEYGANVVSLAPRKRGQAGWKAEWQTSEAGTPLPNLFNVMVALRNHPKLMGTIAFDEMATTVMLRGADGLRPITDNDTLFIQEELQRTGLRRVSKGTVQDGIDYCASENRYHPVRDYLAGLVWDGKKRISTWLSYYLGVENNDYVRTIGRLFLIALVARVMQPGCKADYMLILEGPQGALKSSACRVLAGEWFSDNLPDLARGDAVRTSMHLRGKWLIEIGELSSFNAAESHTLKEFLTQTEERYTPKYARREVYEPRQCLFIGSTNEDAYLRDATGARRFWPAKVVKIDLQALTDDRDQVLAEAYAEFQAGAQWWPDRDFEAEHIVPQQGARYEVDPWEEHITAWLAGGLVYDDRGMPVFDEDAKPLYRQPIESTTAKEILVSCLAMKPGQVTVRETRRVSAILKRIGWYRNEKDSKHRFERVSEKHS